MSSFDWWEQVQDLNQVPLLSCWYAKFSAELLSSQPYSTYELVSFSDPHMHQHKRGCGTFRDILPSHHSWKHWILSIRWPSNWIIVWAVHCLLESEVACIPASVMVPHEKHYIKVEPRGIPLMVTTMDSSLANMGADWSAGYGLTLHGRSRVKARGPCFTWLL